jgi:hypothetical protein
MRVQSLITTEPVAYAGDGDDESEKEIFNDDN